MTGEIEAVATALGASDVLVLQRDGDSLRLVGGTGRGAVWAGSVEVDSADEPHARLAAPGTSPVRLAGSEPVRVIGPYRSPYAALVPVGDDHVVAVGSESPIGARTLSCCDMPQRPRPPWASHPRPSCWPMSWRSSTRFASCCDTGPRICATPPATWRRWPAGRSPVSSPPSCWRRRMGRWSSALAPPPRNATIPSSARTSYGSPDGWAMSRWSSRTWTTPALPDGPAGWFPATRWPSVTARTEPSGGRPRRRAAARLHLLCLRVGRSLADAAEVLLSQAAAREQLSAERDLFARQARTDALTGLGNRVAWTDALEVEATRRARYGRPVVVMTVDVDGLKRANDRFGHVGGDELLTAAASILRSNLRDSDVVARIGGDEFGILPPETEPDAMPGLVARIQAACTAWRGPDPNLRLSLSIGWAVPGAGEELHDALRTADERMYRRSARHNPAGPIGPFRCTVAPTDTARVHHQPPHNAPACSHPGGTPSRR